MGLFGSKVREDAPVAIPDHITNRVRRLPGSDLVSWADQAIYTTGRYLTLYQRDPSSAHLSEARTGAQALLAIVEEIARRDGV